MACDIEAVALFEYPPVIEFNDAKGLRIRHGFEQPLAGRRSHARSTIRHYIVGGLD